MSGCREDMYLLVDCECSPFTERDVIEACLLEMRRSRLEWSCNPRAVCDLTHAIERMELYLLMRIDRGLYN